MEVLIFSTASNLTEAINLSKERIEEEIWFSIGSNEDHSLRYIQYHLQEHDVVIIDNEMSYFEFILDEVIDRKFGERLKTKMIIISTKTSKDDLEKELSIGGDTEYKKVDYTKTSWLYELLKN